MVEEIVQLAKLLTPGPDHMLEPETVKLLNAVLRDKLEEYRKPVDPVVQLGGDIALPHSVYKEWTEGVQPAQGGGG